MDATSDLRRSAYLLLIAVGVAIAAAKIVGAENVFEPSRYAAPTPGGYGLEPDRKWPAARPDPTMMMSSNDRSRWATVRALVDDGTYVIGRRVYPDAGEEKTFTPEGITNEEAYKSLDIVLRPISAEEKARGGPITKEFYSSKPPLFATMLAGEYWLLKKAFGWSIVDDRWMVMTTILLTVNVLPFALYLVLLAKLIETTGRTDFGRLLAFTTTCVGTFLTTFTGTLNNHSPAAFCVVFAMYPLLIAMAEKREITTRGYLASGFFGGLMVTFELPSAALLAGIAVPLFFARPKQMLLFYLPAALIPIAALFACNYAALGQLMPAYGEFGGPWYDFEGSHWKKRGTPAAKGIDFNNEPTTIYAFHLLLGHHGWFSLTPVWLLALLGLVPLAAQSAVDVQRIVKRSPGPVMSPALLAAITLVVSIVLFAFYLSRTASYNYGGNTSGPRWLFWLIPLWLLAVPVGADRLTCCRAGRVFAAVLLGASVLSVFYPAWNPWRPPWIMQMLEFSGVKRY